MRQALRSVDPTPSLEARLEPVRDAERCAVCGCSDLRLDEVLDRGLLLLGECPRCDHRFTRRAEAPEPAPQRIARAQPSSLAVRAARCEADVASAA